MQKSRILHKSYPLDGQGLFLCRNDVQKSGMKYGYARVSTDGQSLDTQVKQLRAAGAEKIFKETASGATDRPRPIAQRDRRSSKKATC